MSRTTTIRVTYKTYEGLKLIAEQEHSSMQNVLDKMLKEHETKKFFENLEQSVRELKDNQKEWTEELNERNEWDGTLLDGLEDETDETW